MKKKIQSLNFPQLGQNSRMREYRTGNNFGNLVYL